MTMGRAPPGDAEVTWTWVQQEQPLLAYAQVVHKKQPRTLTTACPPQPAPQIHSKELMWPSLPCTVAPQHSEGGGGWGEGTIIHVDQRGLGPEPVSDQGKGNNR